MSSEIEKYNYYLSNSAIVTGIVIIGGTSGLIGFRNSSEKIFNRFRWILGISSFLVGMTIPYFMYQKNEAKYRQLKATWNLSEEE